MSQFPTPQKIEKISRYLDTIYLSNLVFRQLVIDCKFGEATCKERAIREQEASLSVDGALQEGEEDVGNGLNGAEGERVAATIHARVEGEGAGLALGEVLWADTSSLSHCQQLVARVSADEGGYRFKFVL